MTGKRLAYARVMQESNAFCKVPTTLADFERTHMLEGDELYRRTESRLVREVPGFVRNAELTGLLRAVKRFGKGQIEPVPILSAWAISGGPLARACADELERRLVLGLEDALRNGPIDGMFLALHGAMSSDGEPDIEGRMLESVRNVIGPKVPLSVTFDLHGLLTSRKMSQLDFLSAYRTNPHRDHRRTGLRAGRMLVRTMLGEPRPFRAWRSLPTISSGGSGVDFLKPSSAIFSLMKKIENEAGVIDVSLFICHPWNDHPGLGWSVAAFATTQSKADEVADRIADAAWELRDAEPPRFLEADEAIERIRRERLRRALGTICVCDASDVVGAGAAGENTRLLSALLGASDLKSYVPLRDAVAIESLWGRPEGESVTLTVGGRFCSEDNPPLEISGRIGRQLDTEAFGKIVVMDLEHVKLVLTEGAPLVMKPEFYRQVGLDPLRADVTVVKSFFPFRIFFFAENRLALYVKTRGATDLDRVRSLRFEGPVHPVESLSSWRELDKARRRGVV